MRSYYRHNLVSGMPVYPAASILVQTQLHQEGTRTTPLKEGQDQLLGAVLILACLRQLLDKQSKSEHYSNINRV